MSLLGVEVAYGELSTALSSLTAANTDLDLGQQQQPDANRSDPAYLRFALKVTQPFRKRRF